MVNVIQAYNSTDNTTQKENQIIDFNKYKNLIGSIFLQDLEVNSVDNQNLLNNVLNPVDFVNTTQTTQQSENNTDPYKELAKKKQALNNLEHEYDTKVLTDLKKCGLYSLAGWILSAIFQPQYNITRLGCLAELGKVALLGMMIASIVGVIHTMITYPKKIDNLQEEIDKESWKLTKLSHKEKQDIQPRLRRQRKSLHNNQRRKPIEK